LESENNSMKRTMRIVRSFNADAHRGTKSKFFTHKKSCISLVFLLILCLINPILSGAQQCADKPVEKKPVTGAERLPEWINTVRGKRIGILANHTAMAGGQHLVDTLLHSGIDVVRIFTPEHGFRGKADAGEQVADGVDAGTGIPIVSLYGEQKKPTPKQLQGIDMMLFDIQDVGVRFYTYISSLHYMMEACAENNIPLMVLDRPNPNGDYFDGPVLKPGFKSFVGMHPIPLVHGLTVGELARMINGEGWLRGGIKCTLFVVEVDHYSRELQYQVPIPPSPNLPNHLSIRLYPSLCLFEATQVSIGRGTTFPFQVIGYPDSTFGTFSFIPKSIEGMAKDPLQKGVRCFGEDLRDLDPYCQRFTLQYFIKYYHLSGNHENFTTNRRWFNLLAGTDVLLTQIEAGMTEEEIRASWKEELGAYDQMRQPYLLYKTKYRP
jgi:uncharacterized protein YbbC (DUF1343 family)